jgi:hypothetical protein
MRKKPAKEKSNSNEPKSLRVQINERSVILVKDHAAFLQWKSTFPDAKIIE